MERANRKQKVVYAPYGKRPRSRATMDVETVSVSVQKPTYRIAGRNELKNIDSGVPWPAFGVGNATVTLLNGCAQGTTALTRLGRRITLRSLYIRGFVGMAATSTGSTPLRLLVVYDKQANATAPVATDILTVDNLAAVNNLGNSRRFVTLLDHVVPSIGTAGPQQAHMALYKKLNHAVEFNAGSAGTIADIQTGSVYVLTYTGTGVAVASLATSMIARVRFEDN